MKITVSSEVLAKSLTKVAKAVPTKTANPILQNFYFVGTGDTLNIIGSDASVTICDTINTAAEGKICLPLNLLTFVKALPACDVTIETSDNICHITYKGGTSSMPAFVADDYPDCSFTATEAPITINGSSLTRALAHTIPCVQADEMRPQLSGILFDSKEDSLTLVGTDSRVLSTFPINSNRQIETFILPLATASILNALCSLSDVEIAVGEKQCWFHFGSTTITSRKIVGKFPDYKRVFPQNNPLRLTAPKSALLDTIRRVATCANKASDTIKLSLDLMGATFEASDAGFGVSAKETPENFNYDGTDLVIGFRAAYLLKCINAIESSEVVLTMSDAKRAAVVTADNAENDPGQSLIMPVQI